MSDREGQGAVRFGDTRLSALFWEKVSQDQSGCWVWQACLVDGYGQLRRAGRRHYAHRLAYEELVGPVTMPALDHLCRNRACVNPAHLEQVTHRDNLLRGDTFTAHNANKTHCYRGHPLSGENLLIRQMKNGMGRVCRECRRIWNANYKAGKATPAGERP